MKRIGLPSWNSNENERKNLMKVDVLVVGAGFSGSVVAERLAARGLEVLLIDKRPHIGGNAYDTPDRHGVLMHPYGPHILHKCSTGSGISIAVYRLETV
jgi:phytoene dehydrogenase-like protein